MKLSSLLVGLVLVLLVAAFASFGWALEYACTNNMHFGWSVIPPVCFCIAAMIGLAAAEQYAARGQ